MNLRKTPTVDSSTKRISKPYCAMQLLITNGVHVCKRVLRFLLDVLIRGHIQNQTPSIRRLSKIIANHVPRIPHLFVWKLLSMNWFASSTIFSVLKLIYLNCFCMPNLHRLFNSITYTTTKHLQLTFFQTKQDAFLPHFTSQEHFSTLPRPRALCSRDQNNEKIQRAMRGAEHSDRVSSTGS